MISVIKEFFRQLFKSFDATLPPEYRTRQAAYDAHFEPATPNNVTAELSNKKDENPILTRKGLLSLKKTELLQICDSSGIKYTSKQTKAELVKLICLANKYGA